MTPGLKKFWKGPNTTSSHQKFDRKIIKWFPGGYLSINTFTLLVKIEYFHI